MPRNIIFQQNPVKLHYVFSILLMFYLSSCFAQDNNHIVVGEYAIIHSDKLNQDQYIMIHVPEGIDSTEKLPVLYVLDGAIHFYSAVGVINTLGGSAIPKMVIVGVINNNRYEDFSPDNYENYAKYFENELIPYIEKMCPVSSYRTLMGHSIAGLYTVNTFINRTCSFNAYLAVDPSISFGNSEEHLSDFLDKLQQQRFDNISIYTAVANTIPDDMTYSDMESDTSKNTLHIRSILKLNKELSKINELHHYLEYFEDESHTSLPYIAIYKGLKSIFSFYEIPASVWDSNSSSSTILSNHFQDVSTRMGYTIKPPEAFVNSLAYYILNKGNNLEAKKLFQINLSNYPESSNVYDSMGDYFITIEDDKNALEYYKKANEITSTPERLEKIESLKN